MAQDEKGIVFQIQRFSLDDGPGIRTTVFLKGCQLRCPWCHNPESIDARPEILFHAAQCIRCAKCAAACPVGAISDAAPGIIDRSRCERCMKCVDVCPTHALERTGREMTVAEVLEEVLRDAAFYQNSGGGMTVSGGEPTRQPAFLLSLLSAAKAEGLHTCIETNGLGVAETYEKILPFLDLVLLDIKHIDSGRHASVVGAPNETIVRNAALFAKKAEVILRTPLIPGFNDTQEFMEGLAALAKSIPEIGECHLIPYHEYGLSKYDMLGIADRAFHPETSLGEKPQAFRQFLEGQGLRVKVL